MNPSSACTKLIQQFEGCAKKQPDGTFIAYPDPGTGGDPWTIGWGSTGANIKKGTVWTQAQCDARFAEHVAEFAAGVAKVLGGAKTSQSQFDAMVSFAYNVGIGNLAASTLLKLHKAGDYAGAAAQFARWNKAAGKVLPGLTKRRAAEAALYASASPSARSAPVIPAN
ncbi:MAG TPA: lysozyme [Allosphingosinicella sp.]|jgi:GH24 family phage-related lysozyme (muramidase)